MQTVVSESNRIWDYNHMAVKDGFIYSVVMFLVYPEFPYVCPSVRMSSVQLNLVCMIKGTTQKLGFCILDIW